jgi:hypothetical protein
MANAAVAFDGWNASGVGWGDQPWGEGVLDIAVTGSVGTVTEGVGDSVLLTGVLAVTIVGQVLVDTGNSAFVTVTGVQGSSSVGPVTVAGTAAVSLVGVAGTAVVGQAVVALSESVIVSGVQGAASVGQVTVDTSTPAIVTVTGVQGTSSLGPVSVHGAASFPLTGVQGTGQVGSIIFVSTNVLVTGVQATGRVGATLVWGVVNDDNTVTWVQVPT